MPIWTVTSTQDLEDAFARAADGDRIDLAPGTYDAAVLSGRHFTAGLTIASADPDRPAVFNDSLRLISVSGVTVQDIDLDAAALASGYRVEVLNSARVTLQDMLVEGHLPTEAEGVDADAPGTRRHNAITDYGYDRGILMRDSTDVTLDGIELRDLRVAVALNDAYDTTIRGLDIHAVREGINMFDVRGVLIENSTFHNFKPWKNPAAPRDDHPDMIQFWGTNSTFGVHDLTIRNNDFWQDPGDLHTQTIYGSSSGRPITHSNFTITGNTIVNGHMNAIAVYDVQGVYIADNILLPKADLPDVMRQVESPGIVVIKSPDAVVEGNTFVPHSRLKEIKAPIASLEDGTVTLGENTLLSLDPASPLFWRTVADQVAAGTWGDGGIVTDTSPDTPVETDVDTGPDTPTIPETDIDTLIDGALDRGLVLKQAAATGGVVKSKGEESILLGGAGDDILRADTADSLLIGGEGADKFVFDFRRPDGPVLHTAADLDFAAGDYLHLLGPEASHVIKTATHLGALLDTGALVGTRTDDGEAATHLAGLADHLIVLPTLLSDPHFDWLL